MASQGPTVMQASLVIALRQERHLESVLSVPELLPAWVHRSLFGGHRSLFGGHAHRRRKQLRCARSLDIIFHRHGFYN